MAKIINRYLDTNGDGTGTKNANGNYSSVADIFYIQPPAGSRYEINRMIVTVQDTGAQRAEYYGALGTALTNGITVREQNDDGTFNNLTDGITIKTNAGWGSICYDVDLKSWGAGDSMLLVRWTFRNAGDPIQLNGNSNDRLEVVLNDDLSGLVAHYFMVQGVELGVGG
jgi:hypothetical protein